MDHDIVTSISIAVEFEGKFGIEVREKLDTVRYRGTLDLIRRPIPPTLLTSEYPKGNIWAIWAPRLLDLNDTISSS